MPRNNQLGLGAPRSPPASMPFNSYTGQLAVSVQDTAASQWTDGEFTLRYIASHDRTIVSQWTKGSIY